MISTCLSSGRPSTTSASRGECHRHGVEHRLQKSKRAIFRLAVASALGPSCHENLDSGVFGPPGTS